MEDIKSLCVALYPVPGLDHEQVHNNPGWMKMEGNNLPTGSTNKFLACTLFLEMLPIVLSRFSIFQE